MSETKVVELRERAAREVAADVFGTEEPTVEQVDHVRNSRAAHHRAVALGFRDLGRVLASEFGPLLRRIRGWVR